MSSQHFWDISPGIIRQIFKTKFTFPQKKKKKKRIKKKGKNFQCPNKSDLILANTVEYILKLDANHEPPMGISLLFASEGWESKRLPEELF